MKKYFIFLLIGSGLFFAGCSQSRSIAVWEDTKTFGRHLHRKAKLLWRKDVDSRMVETAEDFTPPAEEEYIPYREEDIKKQKTDFTIPQPMEDPGAEGSSIPGIEAFSKPDAKLADLFSTIYFNTDSHQLTAKEKEAIKAIAIYMKETENLYIFAAGHCDERASEEYNLALGTRRANSVRSLLVKYGVNPNQIYTISFGKELPVALGHTKEAWAKNRRVEFKLFEHK